RGQLLVLDPAGQEFPDVATRPVHFNGAAVHLAEHEVSRRGSPQRPRAAPPSHPAPTRWRASIRFSLTPSPMVGAKTGCARSTKRATARNVEAAFRALTSVASAITSATAKPGESAPSECRGGSHHPPNSKAPGSSSLPSGGSISTCAPSVSTSEETV